MANAFRKVFCFSIAGIILSLSSYAQLDSAVKATDAAGWEKKTLREVPFMAGHSREEIRNTRDWKWECIGPNVQPAELNPGGKAIPAYAAGRGNGTGRINFLYVHPRDKHKVWACSPTGGVWWTHDEGKNWNEAGTDQLPISGVSSITVHPKKWKQWIISTGDGDDQFMFTDGIWRTTNGGKTYECLNGSDPSTALPFHTEDGPSFIGKVVTLPDNFNFIIAATSRGLWVCEDATPLKKSFFSKVKKEKAYKWKRVAEGQFYDIEIIDSPGKKRVIAAAGDRVILSFDEGITWEWTDTPKYKNPESFPFLRINLEYSPSLPNFLYAIVTCSEAATASKLGEASLYLFDIPSRQWQKIRDMNMDVTNMIPTRARAFAVSPIDANLLLCANVQPVFMSRDGGKTFSKIEKNQMHDDLHHIEFSSDGKTVWASHDGGVSVSYDQGLHWKSRENGIGAANVFGVSSSQTKEAQFAYGAYDTGGNVLRNGKWNHVSWGDGFETIISPTDPNVMFTTMQNGNIQASTTGDNFETSIHNNSKTEWNTWIRMHPKNHSTIYCSGSKLMKSDDLGKNWVTIFDCKAQDTTLFNVYRFFLSPDHPEVMYLYILDEETKVHPQIWRTFNLLEKNAKDIYWEKVTDCPMSGWIVNISVDPEDSRNFWVLFNRPESDGKIWYFDGDHYSDQTVNLNGAKAESMILQKGEEKRLYIGTNYGVFTRSKSEDEWTLLLGLPGTSIKALDINYVTGKLVVGTFGRGLWQGDLVK